MGHSFPRRAGLSAKLAAPAAAALLMCAYVTFGSVGGSEEAHTTHPAAGTETARPRVPPASAPEASTQPAAAAAGASRQDRLPPSNCSLAGVRLSPLEAAGLEVIQALQGFPNVTVWPVGGTLIHFLRHGRYSDYEAHDQEYDLDLAIAAGANDTVPLAGDVPQWIADTLAGLGILRPHVVKNKKTPPGTGTCRRWSKGTHVACKHIRLGLLFDFFIGTNTPELAARDEVLYAPLGVQPRAILHPMGRCRAWNTWVHCPREPYRVLKAWGVTTGYEVKEGCLLFPRHVQKALKRGEGRQYAAEARGLVAQAGVLQGCGYGSFYKQAKEDAECVAAIRDAA